MSIIKHITLQKIVAHDFQYDPRSSLKYGRSPKIRDFVSLHAVVFKQEAIFHYPSLVFGRKNPSVTYPDQ